MAATIIKRRSTAKLPVSNPIQAIHVDPESFRELAVSNRHMIRMDEAVPNHRGLKDVETGELFVVDGRRLHDAKR